MDPSATRVHPRRSADACRGVTLAPTDFLHGDCVWTGAGMARDARWVKTLPPELLAQIDTALAGVQHLDWRRFGHMNFPRSAAAA